MRDTWYEKEINKLIKEISAITNESEMVELFDCILTPREINDIARRLEIKKLLEKGTPYVEIKEKLAVSPTIIARISNKVGYGFRRSSSVNQNRTTKDSGSSKKKGLRYKGSPSFINIIKNP